MSISNDCFLLACYRVELSESLMSAVYALQKALGEPNAFSKQGAVCVKSKSLIILSGKSENF